MKIEDIQLIKKIIEGAVMAADKPLSKRGIKDLFDELECPDDDLIEAALSELQSDNDERGFDLVKVASGYRYQVKQELSPWIAKLWKERTPRYSRALLETLSLIAYRQPITRGEIEEIRGVAVSSQIVRTLLERDWVKVVGHREVPGRPAVYATTKVFLDYFNLSSLDQLPPLAEIRDLNEISRDFNVEMPPELLAAEEQLQTEGAASNDASIEDGTSESKLDEPDSSQPKMELDALTSVSAGSEEIAGSEKGEERASIEESADSEEREKSADSEESSTEIDSPHAGSAEASGTSPELAIFEAWTGEGLREETVAPQSEPEVQEKSVVPNSTMNA